MIKGIPSFRNIFEYQNHVDFDQILMQSNLDQGNNHFVKNIDVIQNLSKSDFFTLNLPLE
jgi:hypothetical protein